MYISLSFYLPIFLSIYLTKMLQVALLYPCHIPHGYSDIDVEKSARVDLINLQLPGHLKVGWGSSYIYLYLFSSQRRSC